MKPNITGFFDYDGASSFQEQIALAQRNQMEYICLRSYNGQPIIELSDNDLKKIMLELKTAKLKIAVLDTSIPSYDLYDDKRHADALDEFKYMIKVADRLKVSHLFFRLPKFNDVIEEYDNINKRLEPYVDAAMKNGKKIILLPVNNYKANTYTYLFKKIKSNVLSFAFDPVAIMMNNESTTTAYRLLRTMIGAVMCIDADHQNMPKLIGYGKTDIVTIFKKLLRDRYAGFLMVDNRFHTSVFNVEPKKVGLFKKIFSNDKKKKENEMLDLSKKIFPNEETKNVTIDDILENQIKVLRIIFK
ncbi:MAG: TIM barrel protein [Acholeplasmataceae bacterium]|nr:TIM barrel protein [Acholeplasmataceae bacterium]